VITWFHNHSRTLTSTRGDHSQSVLNLKPKPKLLQGWQAYHALTYESQWKDEVDKTWAEYKIKWESEHPDQKPGKTRFEIMTDFMKEKFAQATPEILKQVEDYRKKMKEENPFPGREDSEARNLALQS
jgi:hypothetical protein